MLKNKSKVKLVNNRIWYNVGKVIAYIPIRLFFRFTVVGEKKISNKKTIFTMNHLSALDPIIVGILYRPHIYFMAKKELARNKIFRWFLRRFGCIFVDRESADIGSIKKGMQVLDSDNVLMLFPEGTRNKGDSENINPFKTGVAYFALKTHSPIRPFYIKHRTKIFSRNYIICGEEYTLEELYDMPINKETLQIATRIIWDKTNELKERLDQTILVKKENKGRK